MKYIKKLLFILITASAFTACKKNPTSCFSLNKDKALVGEGIVCDASCSTNAKKYFWLGKGMRTPGNESGSIDTVRFELPGTYTIKLEVTNGGKDDISSQTVMIY